MRFSTSKRFTGKKFFTGNSPKSRWEAKGVAMLNREVSGHLKETLSL